MTSLLLHGPSSPCDREHLLDSQQRGAGNIPGKNPNGIYLVVVPEVLNEMMVILCLLDHPGLQGMCTDTPGSLAMAGTPVGYFQAVCNLQMPIMSPGSLFLL